MAKKIGLLLAVSATCVFSSIVIPTDSTEFDIFIMMGQSNMSGDGGQVQAQDTVTNPRIDKWWNMDSQWGGNTSYGWMKGQEAFGQPYWGACGLGGMCLGPSRAFAQVLVDSNQSKTVGVANIAYSGSAIESWVKGGQYYQRNLNWIAQLRTGGIIRGIVWHQGEANSGPMTPSYGQVLAQMIEDYRTDLGLPNLPFIAGMIGTTGLPTDNRINCALDSLQNAHSPNFKMVSSAGTTFYDNVHFNNASQRLMGQRYAQACLSLTKGSTLVAHGQRSETAISKKTGMVMGGRFDIRGRSIKGTVPAKCLDLKAIQPKENVIIIGQ